MLIVCEGQNTEPGYFEYVRHALRAATLRVEILGGRDDPLRLVRFAVSRRDEARAAARRERDPYLGYDAVWAVVDVDEHHHLAKAIQLAATERIEMAVSNPCFEIWALLHFVSQNAYLKCAEASKRLSAYMPEYAKLLDCGALKGRYEVARARAVALDEMHRANGILRGNPSSDAWRLVDNLILSSRAAGVTSSSSL